MGLLLPLRYILKIPSSELAKQGWHATLPLEEAIDKGYMTMLASSDLIRTLDRLKGIEIKTPEVKRLKREIERLKEEKNGVSNRRQLVTAREKLLNLLYLPDYLNVVMENQKDYDRANKGFVLNGIKYKRFFSTSAGVKMSTIIYVNEIYYQALKDHVECGRDLTKAFVPAKLQAYQSLTCSSSTPVSWPKKVVVVHDAEVSFTDSVIELDDSYKPYPKLEVKDDYPITNNTSDGFGLMMPHLADQWAEDLHLDYRPSGFTIRNAFTKGMAFVFDFQQFAKEVAKTDQITDVWGQTHPIKEVDLILTTSMLKLWDSYSSIDHYIECCQTYGYTFSVTKYTPKVLDNERTLNYQFIQSLYLDDEDIEALIKPTVDEIKEVLGGDYRKTIAYLRGIHLNEQTKLDSYDYINALMIEPEVVNDPYVRSKIHELICKRINQSKIGVLKVKGNYQILSGDPYLLCQSMFGLEKTGLLKRGEYYSNYWTSQGIHQVAAFRAPMICHNNIRVFDLKATNEMKKWYQYMGEVCILNGWDCTCQALCGADFDGKSCRF